MSSIPPPAAATGGILTSITVLPFLLALYTSYVFLAAFYSAFFGPLSKIPGPKIRAFSKFPQIVTAVRGSDAAEYTALHRKYGPVLRIGPSTLSYAGGAESWKAVYGFKKPGQPPLHKDTFFYGKPPNGVDGIITADDPTHSRQRRLVSHAFADKSLKELEPMLKQWCATFISKLSEKAETGEALDLLKYYNCTTFDMMGDLTFNEGLDMLENGEYSSWVKTIFDSIKESVMLRSLRMSSTVMDRLVTMLVRNNPKIQMKTAEHWAYTTERVERRLAKKPERTDLWSKLLLKDGQDGGLSLDEQHTIAAVFMIAGTETTATALSGVTYYLTQNPTYLKKLQMEIRSTHSSLDDMTLESVARLKYLHAVIQEGMRMYPPVPTHLFRKTPKGGAELCGYFVPEDTALAVHHYATYRNPELWHRPNEFRPERWLGDPEFKDDRLDAWEPFSVGPRNCLGKNLAWHEMRLIMVSFLLNFDVQLLEESKTWPDQKIFTLWEKVPLMCKIQSAATST